MPVYEIMGIGFLQRRMYDRKGFFLVSTFEQRYRGNGGIKNKRC